MSGNILHVEDNGGEITTDVSRKSLSVTVRQTGYVNGPPGGDVTGGDVSIDPEPINDIFPDGADVFTAEEVQTGFENIAGILVSLYELVESIVGGSLSADEISFDDSSVPVESGISGDDVQTIIISFVFAVMNGFQYQTGLSEALDERVDTLEENVPAKTKIFAPTRALHFTSVHVADEAWLTDALEFTNSADIRITFRPEFPDNWDTTGDRFCELITQSRDGGAGSVDNFEMAVFWSNGISGQELAKPYIYWEWTPAGETSEATNFMVDAGLVAGQFINIRLTQDFSTGTLSFYKEVNYGGDVVTSDGKYWELLDSRVDPDATSIANDSNLPGTYPDGEPWAIGYRMRGDIAAMEIHDGIDENKFMSFTGAIITPGDDEFVDNYSHTWTTDQGEIRAIVAEAGSGLADNHGVFDVVGKVSSIVAGYNTIVDDTDPENPIISATSSGVALGETDTTAYRGDRGKTAYDHSQLTSGNPHNVTKSDVGLPNANNTSDAAKPISTLTQAALDAKLAIANNLSDILSTHTSRYNLRVPMLFNAVAVYTTNVAALTGVAAATDGITPANGDIVLLTAQTTASQNGPWSVNTGGAWTRPLDFPTGGTIRGRIIQIASGTKFANSIWGLPSTSTITIDTTSQSWRLLARPSGVFPRIAANAGEYYSMGGQSSAGAGGLVSAGKLALHPIWLEEGTIDRIGVSTTVAAVSTYRLGLYKSNPITGLPDGEVPVLDAGTVNMNNAAGVQEISVSHQITEAGLYWAAILVDAYTAAPTTHNVTYSSNSGIGIQGLPQDLASLGRYRVGRTYGLSAGTGSLPTCPTASMSWLGTMPRIFVRYA